MMNTVDTEFSSVEVWFTDQGSKALETEDNVNLTLIRYFDASFTLLDRHKKEIFNRTKIQKICFLSFARKFGDK